MFNEDGSVDVVYNGEIYNFQEVAVELTDLGHPFRSRTDTDVIVHSWEEWANRASIVFAACSPSHFWASLGKHCFSPATVSALSLCITLGWRTDG